MHRACNIIRNRINYYMTSAENFAIPRVKELNFLSAHPWTC